jgi:hypothetical protein
MAGAPAATRRVTRGMWSFTICTPPCTEVQPVGWRRAHVICDPGHAKRTQLVWLVRTAPLLACTCTPVHAKAPAWTCTPGTRVCYTRMSLPLPDACMRARLSDFRPAAPFDRAELLVPKRSAGTPRGTEAATGCGLDSVWGARAAWVLPRPAGADRAQLPLLGCVKPLLCFALLCFEAATWCV